MFNRILLIIVFSLSFGLCGAQGIRMILEYEEYSLGTMFLVCASVLLIALIEILFAT